MGFAHSAPVGQENGRSARALQHLPHLAKSAQTTPTGPLVAAAHVSVGKSYNEEPCVAEGAKQRRQVVSVPFDGHQPFESL